MPVLDEKGVVQSEPVTQGPGEDGVHAAVSAERLNGVAGQSVDDDKDEKCGAHQNRDRL